MADIIKLAEGDVVALKKGHPCGANQWEIMALGFMLSRGQFARFRASVSGFREALRMEVAPYGKEKVTMELLARFMQPTGGTALRKGMGRSLYRRISSSRL